MSVRPMSSKRSESNEERSSATHLQSAGALINNIDIDRGDGTLQTPRKCPTQV